MSTDKKLIIFDYNGTLVTTQSGETFPKTVGDWEWMPNRINILRSLILSGVTIAIATNQGGVAFGYHDESDLLHEIYHSLRDISDPLPKVYVCFNHPSPKAQVAYRLDDPRRKPHPGMLLEAMRDAGIGPDDTLMVGDRDEDRQAADAAGVTFMTALEFFGIGLLESDG